MSFLYKALLKDAGNNEQQPSAAVTTNNETPQAQTFSSTAAPMVATQGFNTFAAEPTRSSAPTSLWVALGVCLLVIGLLAGYLFGQQTGNVSPIQAQLAPKETNSASQEVTQELSFNAIDNENKDDNENKESEVDQAAVIDRAQNIKIPVTDTPTHELEPEPSSVSSELEVSQSRQLESNTNTVDIDSTNQIEFEVEGQPIVRSLPDEAELQAIPEELRNKFEMAVQATEDLPEQEQSDTGVQDQSSLLDISELSVVDRGSLPQIIYQMHIFASDKSERWVKVNNQTLYEGDELERGMVLREIRQGSIVWETNFNRFKQEALTDYIRQ